MKIVHIITGLYDGGAESVLYRLCAAEKQHEHLVISLVDEGKYGPLLRAAGIPVYCICMSRMLPNPLVLFRLFSLIRGLRPDVVQTWMYHADLLGGLMARLAGVPNIIWTLRNTTLEAGKSKLSTVIVVLFNAVLSHLVPRHIVSCAQKGVVVHRAIGYAANKFTVIANGYDLSRFKPDQAAGRQVRTQLGIPENVFLIGMVARFDPQKDHANLIAALSILRQAGKSLHCVMAGAGVTSENAALTALLDKYGVADSVQFVGQHDDIPALMNALDLHVLSSSYGEAFPNVVAEAMSCGTPCVATDVGDAALIVAGTGWIIRPRDAQSLAAVIGQAIDEHQHMNVWQSRQFEARQRIENNFSLDRMLAAYRRVWDLKSARRISTIETDRLSEK